MPSAAQLIRRDHKKVEGLFDKFTQKKKPVGKAHLRAGDPGARMGRPWHSRCSISGICGGICGGF
jgi:hypothetical protein